MKLLNPQFNISWTAGTGLRTGEIKDEYLNKNYEEQCMEYVIVINNKELEDREGVAAIEQKLCMDIGQ